MNSSTPCVAEWSDFSKCLSGVRRVRSSALVITLTERILTLHPHGKKGVKIDRAKYDMMKHAILSVLTEADKISFRELGGEVKNLLTGRFEGSISWYYTTVKLDLEARGAIERIEGTRPQLLRLVPSQDSD